MVKTIWAGFVLCWGLHWLDMWQAQAVDMEAITIYAGINAMIWFLSDIRDELKRLD